MRNIIILSRHPKDCISSSYRFLQERHQISETFESFLRRKSRLWSDLYKSYLSSEESCSLLHLRYSEIFTDHTYLLDGLASVFGIHFDEITNQNSMNYYTSKAGSLALENRVALFDPRYSQSSHSTFTQHSLALPEWLPLYDEIINETCSSTLQYLGYQS